MRHQIMFVFNPELSRGFPCHVEKATLRNGHQAFVWPNSSRLVSTSLDTLPPCFYTNKSVHVWIRDLLYCRMIPKWLTSDFRGLSQCWVGEWTIQEVESRLLSTLIGKSCSHISSFPRTDPLCSGFHVEKSWPVPCPLTAIFYLLTDLKQWAQMTTALKA